MPQQSESPRFDSWKDLLRWLPQATESQLMTTFVWAGDQAKAPAEDAKGIAQVRTEAFEQLVGRVREPLRRFLQRRQRCHDPHLAEDVVQEVLVLVYLRAEQYDAGRSFWGWLYRIARNKHIDLLRRTKAADIGRGQTGKPDEALQEWIENLAQTSATPEAAALERERRQQLDQAITRLPSMQQTIVRLRLDGVPGKDIAQRIQRSQAYVSQSYHEALEVLRDRVET